MKIKQIRGGVTAPAGYRAAAVLAKVKPSRTKPDLALLFSTTPAVIAATFTQNKLQGEHVKFCKQQIRGGKARAIVVNAGCANACVGPQGFADAKKMADTAAASLQIDKRQVFVCSTGTIGIKMPMGRVVPAIRQAATKLSAKGGPAAARAIMTTDTVPKIAAFEFKVDGKLVRIGGMAKGAGMIEPNMATLLSFLTTDAAVERGALQRCLTSAVNLSFNKISIDGDQSCNDTVLFMANGMAGNKRLSEKHKDWQVFSDAVHQLTKELAVGMVRDGEGATRLVKVMVEGAANAGDARKAVRAVCNSLLVKTAWFGCDPNWGRVIDAVGYSGAAMNQDLVDITFDDLPVLRKGRLAGASLKQLEKVVRRDEFCVRVNLHLGKASDFVYTCDCSEEYVRINAEYMT